MGVAASHLSPIGHFDFLSFAPHPHTTHTTTTSTHHPNWPSTSTSRPQPQYYHLLRLCSRPPHLLHRDRLGRGGEKLRRRDRTRAREAQGRRYRAYGRKLDRKQDDSPLIQQLPLRLEEHEVHVQPNDADDEISMCLGYHNINGNYNKNWSSTR